MCGGSVDLTVGPSAEPRRVGRRGRRASPTSRSGTTSSGSAGSSPSARCAKAIPIVTVLEQKAGRPRRHPPRIPTTRELAELRDWLARSSSSSGFRSRRGAYPAARAARDGALAAAPGPRAGCDDPSAVRPARRPRRR